ncbi:MAG: dTDP-glucose 4,6-dehydratase [Reichenbachiella sp.]|uniref:dTDP-glucose 4,6-dehydratase n=1 Tax=Reichenbachiella sp. TaxID=2184521 RepID=UPI003299EFA5
MTKKILITGGAGFIGSHAVKYFVSQYPSYEIFNLDKLTYAGNPNNLIEVENSPNYHFIQGDICDSSLIDRLFNDHEFDSVIHFAAESHVDRSIEDPLAFVNTNIIGTVNLLNSCRNFWKDNFTNKLFYHISTDEVYGSLDDGEFFYETTAYDPQSPYSASKASSDHFVRAYSNTYKLPIVISNCSNNYGPNQFPEKLIPLCIQNIIDKKPLPVYGKGENIRDWLFVHDHVTAIDAVFHRGKSGETYNIGGFNEWKNIDLVKLLCQIMDKKLNRTPGTCETLITFVTDRAGHDHRYAIDSSKISKELNWQPSLQFKEGLEKTVDWYLANQQWLADIKSGAYLNK